MPIILPGHAKPTGYSFRVERVRKSSDHLPPFRCDSVTKGRFYLCGHCFASLGDGPATNGAEMWMAGTDRAGAPIIENGHPIVPTIAICHKCGQRAWPAD
jgi:hypothetical protein